MAGYATETLNGKGEIESSLGLKNENPIMSRMPGSFQNVYKELSVAKYDLIYVASLLVLEIVICILILKFVPYTEIDWQAYMEQVSTFKGGERNYYNIRGGTGPLVYPAGFLYLYSIFQRMAGGDGSDIYSAQKIFIALYVIQTAIVLYLYTTVARAQALTIAKHFMRADPKELVKHPFSTAHCIWFWRIAMFFGCCLSKRIHSIFILRLFNDGPAMLLLYISVAWFVKSYWKIGCIFFSLAVSIKMNILLFAPGLLLLLLQSQSSITGTIVCLSICAGIQLIVGYPFLSHYPVAYLRKSFELDRVFMHQWTVNWKFLNEEFFISQKLSLILLTMHIFALGAFACKWLTASQKRYRQQLFLCQPRMQQIESGNKIILKSKRPPCLTAEYICMTMFVSNFIGIAVARTLHYQFYTWYYHTIAMMLWSSNLEPWPLRFVLLGIIEYSFNVFPATYVSSALLQASHFIILSALLITFDVPQIIDDDDGIVGGTLSHDLHVIKEE